MDIIQNLFSLKGKKAIVTGGRRGIGKSIALGLCSAGAEVLIIGSDPSTPKCAEELSKGKYKVHGLTCDLSNLNKIESTFNNAIEIFHGDLDILINNAAIIRRHRAELFPKEDWNKIIDINLNAVFILCQLAGRIMIEKKSGKIINMASMVSFFGGCDVVAYAASKGGIAQITKALSNEWAQYNINVNAIAPGGIITQMNEGLRKENELNEIELNRTPARRMGVPDDIVGTVIYLASKASEYVCGAVLPVDGGYLVR